jgi:hypothetical protein
MATLTATYLESLILASVAGMGSAFVGYQLYHWNDSTEPEKLPILTQFQPNKVAPVTEPPAKEPQKKEMNHEPFLRALYRSFAFWYQKYKQTEISGEFTTVTKEQIQELRNAVEPYYKDKTPDFSKIAEDVFHTGLDVLNKQLKKMGTLGNV